MPVAAAILAMRHSSSDRQFTMEWATSHNKFVRVSWSPGELHMTSPGWQPESERSEQWMT
jgi:hypothetical protein